MQKAGNEEDKNLDKKILAFLFLKKAALRSVSFDYTIDIVITFSLQTPFISKKVA